MKIYCAAINKKSGECTELGPWEQQADESTESAGDGEMYGHVIAYSLVSYAEAEKRARDAMKRQ